MTRRKTVVQPLEAYGSIGDQYLSSKTGGYVLDFYSVSTGNSVAFKGFMTSFSDDFEASFNEESVYGRMDPIVTYQGTQRSINFTWDVIAVSLTESISNLARIEKLMSFLYPKYNSGEVNTIQAAPLIKVRFSNLIIDAASTPPTGAPGRKAGFVPASESGLLGAISGFSYAPNFDPGMFMTNSGQMYPKHVEINCNMRVIHTHNLGWDDKNNWRGDKGIGDIGKTTSNIGMGYPYGTDTLTDNSFSSRLSAQRRDDIGNLSKSEESRFDAQKDRVKINILGGN